MRSVFTATATAEFQAPAEHVFNVATSLRTLSDWVPYLQNVRLFDHAAPFGLGSVFLADQAFAESLKNVITNMKSPPGPRASYSASQGSASPDSEANS